MAGKKYVYAVMDVWRADIEDGAGVIGVYTKRKDAVKAAADRKKEVVDDMNVEYENEEWNDGSYLGYNDSDPDYTNISIVATELDRKD